MWYVNFFDLGAFDGAETQRFFEDMEGSGVQELATLSVHIVEANPELSSKCRARFVDDNRVEVHNFAVSMLSGACLLHLDDCGEGSSIYASKQRLNGDVVLVNHRGIVQLVLDHPKTSCTVNVIKANIEGAEWDLLKELELHDLWSYFDIYCGPGFRLEDMPKCTVLHSKIAEAVTLVNAHIPTIYEYAVPTEAYPRKDKSVDLGPVVLNLITKGSG